MVSIWFKWQSNKQLKQTNQLSNYILWQWAVKYVAKHENRMHNVIIVAVNSSM